MSKNKEIKRMKETINKNLEWLDSKLGPSNKKACQEDREMVLDCVLNSECFKVI